LWRRASGAPASRPAGPETAAPAQFTVRTYYLAQTIEQMRKSLPLTLDAPPAKAPIFVPACSTAEEGLACGWKDFQRTIEAAIDPAFVKQ
jgi:hypothetical protein